MMQSTIQRRIQESIDLKETVLHNESLLQRLERLVQQCVHCYQQGGKLLFCGNGGSAADAQHLAAELSGRFYKNRAPLFAEVLHGNPSYVTAVANDYSFEVVYSRLVGAMGQSGDVLIGLSTSGNSPNVVAAFERARQLGMFRVAFTGETGGELANVCDLLINIPSTNTPRIQEVHMLLGHTLCELIEQRLFG